MHKFVLLVIGFLGLAASFLHAQSRMPEIKLAEVKKSAPTDMLGYEEQPYFLLIGESETALSQGDYDSAALRLIEAMAIEPQNPLNVALLTNLGMIYYYNEQDSMALITLNEAVRREPRLIAARENRARVLTGLGRDNEAYADYSAILDIDSLNTDARYMHGMIALFSGKQDVAKADIDVLNNVVPLLKSTVLATATYYSLTGNNTEAVSLFRKLLETDKQAEYYAALVGCLIAEDNLNEASQIIGEGLERYPKDPELYYYRAVLNKRRYMPDAARADAAQAIRLGANPARVSAIFNNEVQSTKKRQH